MAATAVADKEKAPPWFEAISPHLLRNKAIRTYLTQYSIAAWPEVVKLTMLHGVLTLQKQYPGEILPLERLRGVLTSGQSAVAVESALPDLKERLEGLQAQLADVGNDLHKGAQVGRCCAL